MFKIDNILKSNKSSNWFNFSTQKKYQLRNQYKDSDGDRVPDKFDCKPFNIMRQDPVTKPYKTTYKGIPIQYHKNVIKHGETDVTLNDVKTFFKNNPSYIKKAQGLNKIEIERSKRLSNASYSLEYDSKIKSYEKIPVNIKKDKPTILIKSQVPKKKLYYDTWKERGMTKKDIDKLLVDRYKQSINTSIAHEIAHHEQYKKGELYPLPERLKHEEQHKDKIEIEAEKAANKIYMNDGINVFNKSNLYEFLKRK